MGSAAAAKPALTFEQHVADKVDRYDIALVESTDCYDVVELRAQDAADQETIVLLMRPPRGTGDSIQHVEFRGPAWKRHHASYYATAAYWVLFGEDRRMAAEPKPAPAEIKLPLPPSGPPCPRCHKQTRYECAHVGGRGTCWRNRCPGLDDGSCDRIERWRS